MPRRGAAVHVSTTRRHYKGKVYETHLLRRSYRENGKVKNETLGNLSHLPAPLIDLIKRSLAGEHFLSSVELEIKGPAQPIVGYVVERAVFFPAAGYSSPSATRIAASSVMAWPASHSAATAASPSASHTANARA